MDAVATRPGTGGGARSRVDLHLHSHASGEATNWWVKSLGLGFQTRESFTPPEDAYDLAKRAGMDFVTLTDHETIGGALTLAGRPDFLVGEEVSALFPEDGSSVDVLVFGLGPADHDELQARRGDVHRLVDFLREASLVHVLAHPMFAPVGTLDRAGVERRLVLFGLWEFVNGSRPAEQNRLTREVALGVGPVELRQMALRQGLAVPPHRAIAGTGGSDDHGGIYPGATWSETPRVTGTRDLLAALAAGEVRPGGEDGSVAKMAHTGFKLAGAAVAEGADLGAAGGGPVPADLGPAKSAAPAGAEQILEYLPLLAVLDGAQIRSALVGRYERRVADALRAPGQGFPVLRLLGSIGSFVDAHLFVAPYVGIHGYFGREIQKTRALRRRVLPALRDGDGLKVGVFVDELDEIHGVATMYRNLARLADRPRGDRIRLVRCGGGVAADPRTASLRPIATLPVPLYEGRSLEVPSLLDVMDHVAEEGYDLLHVATPGPLGLAAMVAAGTLGLPVVGTYHTEFGAYAEALSGDTMVAELVELLVREFYERCALVAVPSSSTARSLRERGYRIARFETLRNGVDTRLFDPACREEDRCQALGGGRMILLYAGRVSREKGLERLAAGYLALRRRRDDVHLVIAGDGPYRKDLQAALGEAATFTGFLQGEDLARTFAAADVFVFPSTTDTLGRAVAEAQASGLPAVVFGMGGPQECIRPGASGFVVEPGDEVGFWARVEALLDDPALRARMGREARAFAETLSWERVLDGLVGLYREVAGRDDAADEDGMSAGAATGDGAEVPWSVARAEAVLV